MDSDQKAILQSLYHSNEPPLPRECAIAHIALQRIDKKLAELDTRIAASVRQDEMSLLFDQKTGMEASRHRYAQILSARRRLPPEIISTFISMACWCPADVQARKVRRWSPPVVNFMLVSKGWYSVACSAAYLWADLHFDIRGYASNDMHRIVDLASSWCAKAAQLPIALAIKFDVENPYNGLFIDFMHALARRWGNIKIEAVGVAGLDIIEFIFPSQTSSVVWSKMQALHLRINVEGISDQVGPPPEKSLTSAVDTFPSLQSLAISLSTTPFWIIGIPWSHLSTLIMGSGFDISLPQYFPMLKECINIQECELSLSGRYYRSRLPHESVPTLTLRRLARLKVSSADRWEDDAWFFDRLQLPVLRSMTYTMSYCSNSNGRISALTGLLRRSKCSETLTYLGVNLRDPHLHRPRIMESLFEETPRLDAFGTFRIPPSSLIHLPVGVKTLVVDVGHRDLERTHKELCDFLRQRYAAPLTDGVVVPVLMNVRLHIVDWYNAERAGHVLPELLETVGGCGILITKQSAI